ncbi:hypothetical protein HPB50_013811 [Hyalomma asiaticum]|uniref:Uncharacterized protein n=1 Tax=Hyalomma asiaticum TaxID=266040 RepID=A0ACB7T496_HYAAI|nr:hypothetical protein HPB50_013811 [Hyalomma asiaticum]
MDVCEKFEEEDVCNELAGKIAVCEEMEGKLDVSGKFVRKKDKWDEPLEDSMGSNNFEASGTCSRIRRRKEKMKAREYQFLEKHAVRPMIAASDELSLEMAPLVRSVQQGISETCDSRP